ncbi:NAD(P)-binding domain-containing protein [Paenibacillus sp.]|uniref:NAD(P)-binding domain-containing protein n=1 Tax=Paenibacillus sp. TaxID=58172 RepID=UPI00281134FE|nr:NAD(P)-binding domain-containing protein [Paenibacillus sp.]
MFGIGERGDRELDPILSLVFSSNGRDGHRRPVENDFVFSLIGYQPDAALLHSLGIRWDESMIPAFDPETYETNTQNVFVADVVNGGIANQVFIDDGRLHGREIADTLQSRFR